MATTTNYGWTTPDDTALVKDGAAAIRTLGSSVDTTTKNLNPSTTLGDIEYRSSTANTNTRLGIGTTGQILTVAAGVPSWATASAGGMTLINSGGTTLTGASVAITGIPATYKDLRLVVRNFKPVTGSDHLSVYVNNDTNSRYNRWPVSDASTNGNTSQSWAESSWAYVSPAGETTLFQGTAIFNIFDYANTSTWKLGQMYAINNNVGTPANVNFMQQLIYYNQVTAISSIYLKTTGGDFSSGTAFLYGVS